MIRLLALLLLAVPAFGTDPPKSDLRLPILKAPDAPSPPPGAVWGLNSGQTYAFDSDTPYLIRAIPDGLVTVTVSPGPLTISTVFVDGKGVRERRVYSGKYVVEVEPVPLAKGRVTLVLVKTGATTDADIVLVPIDVNGGEGPKPPPDPDIKPTPTAKALWLVTVEDMQTRSAATAMVQGDTKYWESIRAKGHDFRQYDMTKGEGVNYAKKAALAGVPLPAVLIFDKNGPKVKAEPLAIVHLPDTTIPGVDALILKYSGAK